MKTFKCVLWIDGYEVDYYVLENETKEKMVFEAEERFLKAYPSYPNQTVTVEELNV